MQTLGKGGNCNMLNRNMEQTVEIARMYMITSEPDNSNILY